MRIFCSVGTQFSHDRMLGYIDRWLERNPDNELVAQIGCSEYQLKNGVSFSSVLPDDFASYLSNSELMITHAGMGNIISCLEIGLPMVVVPRIAELGEHRNNHQLDSIEKFRGSPLVNIAQDESEFDECMSEVLSRPRGNVDGFPCRDSLLGYVKMFLDS